MFLYQLNQQVRINPGSETGTVDARAEYFASANHYRVNYVDATGRASTRWVPEYMLSLVAAPGGNSPPGG